MEYLNPINAYNGLQTLLQQGGNVLYFIMLLAFFMFSFIMERLAYYFTAHGGVIKRLKAEWDGRTDTKSWRAMAIRDELISQVKAKTTTNVSMIKTLVAIAPLLGLLGTVTGMISVFDVMALSGSSNARLMAEGVFKATIPTMSGMMVALAGLFLSNFIERKAIRETQRFADSLEVE
ncbi:MotA/TolQ/ExbB proton channel family protein [Fretibacter rubidus]|uniref:MotA/TolQ/ExbB proton channel family protein n=1 Tax=Fretibacter rubidus TaxID=570162 RepID=UPI00352BB70D